MRHIFVIICFLASTVLCHSQDNTGTTVCNGKTLTIYNDYTSFIVTEGRDTLINVRESYFIIHYKDIDQDGHTDILGELGGNTPERYDVYLFVAGSKRFKKVRGFSDFPAPVKIASTKYYYSYHKSGCADMHWDSDLFYISDYKVVKIGNISGRQCSTKGEPVGIFIYRFSKGKKILFKIFKVRETDKYNDGKWGFIRDYWTKSWTQFAP